jgi:putative Mg2+ transporter-C (MgtC) family protein
MDIGAELLYAVRILLSAVLGGLIGWERERADSDAGIRTYMATSMGACAFSLISIHAGGDPTRIAAQVVSGFGFIGAGVIFKERAGVVGLTTAATLWATAAVGMASAFGMYVLAVLTSALLLATLCLQYLLGWKRLSGKGGERERRR